jgi:hypothetical protein
MRRVLLSVLVSCLAAGAISLAGAAHAGKKSGFPFASDVAATVAHVGVFHLGCSRHVYRVTLSAPATLRATLRTPGHAVQHFNQAGRLQAAPQSGGLQRWTIQSREESATATAHVVLRLSRTPASNVCYLRHDRIETTIKPNSR